MSKDSKTFPLLESPQGSRYGRSWRCATMSKVLCALAHEITLQPVKSSALSGRPHNTAGNVWADTAYRSQANESFLAGRLLRSQIHRKNGRSMWFL